MTDENIELERFKFTETFNVEFYIEAINYQKAKQVYDKMFDKNIQLGYDTWKNVADKNINGGKFHVKTYDNGQEATLIDEMWGSMGEGE